RFGRDWSSDVRSSDLLAARHPAQERMPWDIRQSGNEAGNGLAQAFPEAGDRRRVIGQQFAGEVAAAGDQADRLVAQPAVAADVVDRKSVVSGWRGDLG